MSIIAIIGPIGSGKFDLAQMLAAVPGREICSIDDDWKQFKKHGFVDSKRPATNTLVVTNGGSIFFHKEQPKRRMLPIVAVHAPADMVAVVRNFKRAWKTPVCHEDFYRTEFCSKALEMFRTPGAPGYASYQGMLERETRKTIATCDARVASGQYRLGGTPGHYTKWFLNASSMHERMVKVTRRNLKHQFVLALWAQQTGATLCAY